MTLEQISKILIEKGMTEEEARTKADEILNSISPDAIETTKKLYSILEQMQTNYNNTLSSDPNNINLDRLRNSIIEMQKTLNKLLLVDLYSEKEIGVKANQTIEPASLSNEEISSLSAKAEAQKQSNLESYLLEPFEHLKKSNDKEDNLKQKISKAKHIATPIEPQSEIDDTIEQDKRIVLADENIELAKVGNLKGKHAGNEKDSGVIKTRLKLKSAKHAKPSLLEKAKKHKHIIIGALVVVGVIAVTVANAILNGDASGIGHLSQAASNTDISSLQSIVPDVIDKVAGIDPSTLETNSAQTIASSLPIDMIDQSAASDIAQTLPDTGTISQITPEQAQSLNQTAWDNNMYSSVSDAQNGINAVNAADVAGNNPIAAVDANGNVVNWSDYGSDEAFYQALQDNPKEQYVAYGTQEGQTLGLNEAAAQGQISGYGGKSL